MHRVVATPRRPHWPRRRCRRPAPSREPRPPLVDPDLRRRPRADRVQSGQGHVPRDRVHQGTADRVLLAHRPGDAPPSGGPPADHEAVSRTASTVLRSSRSTPRAMPPTGCGRCPSRASEGGAGRLQRDLRPRRPWSGRPTWPPSSSTCPCGGSGAGASSRRRPITMVFDLDPGDGDVHRRVLPRWRWPSPNCSSPGTSTPSPRRAGRRASSCTCRSGTRSTWERVRRDAHGRWPPSWKQDRPELVVSNMRKELRRNKVLIDWSQNHPAKTTVAAYSLRARPEPTVSTPVTWEEVGACAHTATPTCSGSRPRTSSTGWSDWATCSPR